MANVLPFRAWRYNLERVGSLEPVIAPPYDVIGPKQQRELAEHSPFNVVRIDLPAARPEDDQGSNRYTRAAALVEQWKQEQVLLRDTRPTVTIVEESFVDPEGQPRRRWGVLAVVELAEFSEGIIFPHEATMHGPKEDRYRLIDATRMSLSPVFMLYSMEGNPLLDAWERLGSDRPPLASANVPGASRIRLWAAEDEEFLQIVRETLAGCKLLIADGHHRYETALRYRDAQREAGKGAGPWDFGLVYLVNTHDPGLAIFPTHRLLHDLPPEKIQELPALLAEYFSVEEISDRPAAIPAAVDRFLEEHRDTPGAFGLYLADSQKAYGVVLRDDSVVSRFAAEASEAGRQLDVTILHAVVLEGLLGIQTADVAEGRQVTFAKDRQEAFEGVASSEYQAGFFMNATKLDQMLTVAGAGERLPQKSTFFYPKLPTGLVFYDLKDE